jgi:peptidoglycan LD-endopeptidase CwlK
MTLNARSEKNLLGIHPDLVRVVRRTAEIEPFIVTCGLRTLKEQKILVQKKKSRTLDSRHLTGHAIDFAEADGYYDEPDMERIGAAFKQAAKDCGVPIEWGGDWDRRPGKIGWDSPHIQLPKSLYPASGITVSQKVVEAAKTKTSVAAATGTAALTIPNLPAVPDLAPLTAWQGFGEQVSGLLSWAGQRPMLTACLVAYLSVVTFLPSIAARLPWSRS